MHDNEKENNNEKAKVQTQIHRMCDTFWTLRRQNKITKSYNFHQSSSSSSLNRIAISETLLRYFRSLSKRIAATACQACICIVIFDIQGVP